MPENGKVEDILIENCDFGQSHGTVTFGSECIYDTDLTIRNCRMDNHAPILRLKLRPDTPQRYKNITVENITEHAGVIISMRPWKQFFDMKDCKTPPFATVRNITFKNINVTCDRIGDIIGNPKDIIENILFQNCNINPIESDGINIIYNDVITFENVTINGKLFTKE